MKWLLACLMLVLATLRAEAHALGLDYKIKDDVVWIEAYYDDDTPCRAGKIRVVDPDNKLIAAGATDDLGKWSFSRPADGKYTIHINDGFGHLAKRTILVGDAAQPSKADLSDPNNDSNRTEFTRFPIWRLLAGLIVVVAIARVAQLFLRKDSKPRSES